MRDPLLMWSDRFDSAQTDEERRAMTVELATWRARHLTDIPATRRATYTLARLLQLLGDRDKAAKEAKDLMTLCRTPPQASDEEIAAVQRLMEGLGLGSVPAPTVTGAENRRDRRRGRERTRDGRGRSERPERPERGGGSPTQDAKAAAQAGDWAGVRKATEGARGAAATVLRAYAMLHEATAGAAEQLAARVDDVKELLARSAGLPSVRVHEADQALAELIGEPLPAKRGPRMRALEAFAEAHPDKLDELGAAVLRHHVATQGPNHAAPWLVGIVSSALTKTEGTHTREVVTGLQAERSVVVAPYDELPFERLFRISRSATEAGHVVGALRRGVLPREEPDDRKLWTLRITIDGVERMMVVGPHATEGYRKGKAEQLAARIQGLCPRALVLATGSGNEELRERAAAHGLGVEAHDKNDDELLQALAAVEGAAPASAPAAGKKAGNNAPARLVSALEAESFDPAEVKAAVADFRRPDRALRPALRLELPDERVASLLGAVHEAVEPDTSIPEGSTLGIRTAAQGPVTREAITTGPASERFGGPGVESVIDIARALLEDGWYLHRVLRGPTRRESRLNPAVETFASHMGGLWRLLVRKDNQRGEVWFVADLPAEGRAAVPLLLLEEHHRAAVVPNDSELASWWDTLTGAPDAIPWTGAETAAVVAAANAFPASAEPPEPTEEAPPATEEQAPPPTAG